MDFRETFRELWAGSVYMWRRTRGVETDPHARRVAILENAFDKSREQVWRERRDEEQERGLQAGKAVEVQVDVDGERQWLGAGDNYDYGLSRRERNEALAVMVEREIEKSGYGGSGGECKTFNVFELPKLNDLLVDPEPDMDLGHQNLTHEPRQRSWWRNAYERISQSRDEPRALSPPTRESRSRHPSEDSSRRVRVYDDQPPPSLLRTYRDNSKPSDELPPGAQSPQAPGIRTSQDVTGLPMQDRYISPPATRASVTRTDTVLNRLFHNSSVRSKGNNSMYSGVTSVMSNRTHLPINAAPAILAQSVGAGRAVEISPSTLGPSSPVPRDARELHARLGYLPTPPPPVQWMQSGSDQGDTNLPPLPPLKSTGSPGPSHRRESAYYQTRVDDLLGAAATTPIPTTASPISTEDRSQHAHSHRHGLPASLTPRYPRTSRSYEMPFSVESDASPSCSWSAPAPVAPAHIFTPQPMLSRSRKPPQSKDTRRTSVPVRHDSEQSPPLPPFSSHYHLNHLPDARSPPSEPLQF